MGWALARSQVPAGLNSLRGVTVSNQIFFPRMYVNGARQRWGAELSWLLRSLLVRGEFMNVREQRLAQGLHGEDLPALRTQGWYLSATHPLSGHLDNGRPGRFLVSLLFWERIRPFQKQPPVMKRSVSAALPPDRCHHARPGLRMSSPMMTEC